MADDDAPDPRDEKIASLEGTLKSMEATLTSLAGKVSPPPATPQSRPMLKGSDIPPQLRQHMLSQGLSEADLEANAPLVLPFVNTILGAAAQEMMGIIGNVKDDIRLMRMAKDAERFPFIEKLEEDIEAIRETGQKEGRYYDPETAYQIAYARKERQLRAGDSYASPVTTRSRDASASTTIAASGTRMAAAEEPKTPRTATDLQSMTPEQREAFWQANEDTPVRSDR
jgi:hypothetical protein